MKYTSPTALPRRGVPQLPLELLDSIIHEAWTFKLALKERCALFASFCRVNRTWLRLFVRIAFKDVHIPTPTFAHDYLRLIRDRAYFESDDDYVLEDAPSAVDNLCRSLTFHVGEGPLYAPAGSAAGLSPSIVLSCPSATNFISSTLYMVGILNHLPNLRRVCLQYFNWGFNDIGDQGRLMVFPKQVTHLDLSFSFTTGMLDPVVEKIRENYARRWHRDWSLPHVRYLTVRGAPMKFVSDMLSACTALETLEFDNVGPLSDLVYPPDTIHTITIDMGGKVFGEGVLWRRDLKQVLSGGLMRPSYAKTIKIRCASVESDAWRAASNVCATHGVSLVHCYH